MQGRLAQNDVSNHVNVEDPLHVGGSVIGLIVRALPRRGPGGAGHAFADTQALFRGSVSRLPPCDTLYHDLRHTLDVSLAMARLIDGHDRTHPEPERLGSRRAMLGVIIALLHDAGYLQAASEQEVGNGARVHQGARQPQRRLSSRATCRRSDSPPRPASPRASFISQATSTKSKTSTSPIRRIGLLGTWSGTADLLAQMSDRAYLEKCRDFLYDEFVWGGIAREKLLDGREVVNYRSAEDLIRKTPDYYQHVARKRIDHKLGSVDRYAAATSTARTPYQSAIAHTMLFLRHVLDKNDLTRLRRACYSLSATRAHGAGRPASPQRRVRLPERPARRANARCAAGARRNCSGQRAEHRAASRSTPAAAAARSPAGRTASTASRTKGRPSTRRPSGAGPAQPASGSRHSAR
jgi:hypothetical protein